MRFVQRRDKNDGPPAAVAPDLINHLRAHDDTPRIDPVFVARLHADLHQARWSAATDVARMPGVQTFPRQRPDRVVRASRPLGGFWIAGPLAAMVLCLIIIGGYRVVRTSTSREHAAQPIEMSAESASPSPASGTAEAINPASLGLRVARMPNGELVAMLASVTLPPGTEISRTALAGDGPDLLIVVSGVLTVQSAPGERLLSGDGSPVAGQPSSSSVNAEEITLADGDGITFQPGTAAIFRNAGSAPVGFVHATIASPRTALDVSPARQSVMAESAPTTAFSTASGPVTISFDRLLVAPGAQAPQSPGTQILGVGLDERTTTSAASPTALPARGWRNPGPTTVAVFVLSVKPPAASPTPTPSPKKAASAVHRAATNASGNGNGNNGQSGDQSTSGQSGAQDGSGQGNAQGTSSQSGGQGNGDNSGGGAQGSDGAPQDANQSPGQNDQGGSQGTTGQGAGPGSSNANGDGSSIGGSGESDQVGSQDASGQNDQSGNQGSVDQSGTGQSQNSNDQNGGDNGSDSSGLGGNGDAQNAGQSGSGDNQGH